jgi:hypothetical protein
MASELGVNKLTVNEANFSKFMRSCSMPIESAISGAL